MYWIGRFKYYYSKLFSVKKIFMKYDFDILFVYYFFFNYWGLVFDIVWWSLSR